MKKFVMASAAIAGAIAALPAAHAGTIMGFTGPFDPTTWTTTQSGNLTGPAGGSATFTPTTLTIVGGNAISPDPANFVPACTGATAGFDGPCQITTLASAILDPISFNWSYVTADSAGAEDDLFGVIVDGVKHQLSDPGGAISQSGAFSVSPTSSFGFYVNCTDCIEGAATATISSFAAVPEPGTIALLGVGGIVVGVARRKRRPALS
jgi:hypothetical protein